MSFRTCSDCSRKLSLNFQKDCICKNESLKEVSTTFTTAIMNQTLMSYEVNPENTKMKIVLDRDTLIMEIIPTVY